MSNRTSGKLDAHHKTFLRMTFPFISTRHLFQGRCDNPADCASGGAGRDRTDDILLAKQALSQLSYGP